MKQRVLFFSAIVTIFLFILPFSSGKVFAAPWYLGDPQSFGQTLDNAASSNQVQKEGYDMSTQTNMMNSIICLISGCSKNPNSPVGYGHSALAGINNYISAIYTNPPASTYMAFQDVGHSLGFMPQPVYAQGVGFSGLAPLIPVWKVFRNIAYALLAMVMVVIGFMVMFRRKIDPKTVVTVQNALPRIVLTLLLITFSYAIVGILIDAMYLVLAIAFGLFKSTGFLPETRTAIADINLAGASVRDVILSGNLFQVLFTIFPSGAFSIETIANTILSGGSSNIIAQVLLAAPSVLLMMVLSLALLFIFIRLFILFLTAYVQIILALIFGPIQILIGAVPGADGFGGWIKNLVANLAVFPIAGIMFMLSIVFIEIGSQSGGATNTIWAPPYYTLANQSVAAITALFSIGILMMIPNLTGSIKKALKTQGVPMGTGGALGVVAGGAQMLITPYIQGRMLRARERNQPGTSQEAEKQSSAPIQGAKGS